MKRVSRIRPMKSRKFSQILLTISFFKINLLVRLASSEDPVTGGAKIEHDSNRNDSNDSGSQVAS